MAIITLGTMAFDAIETPFGKIDKIVGGSATYVAYAASHLMQPVQQISIVGNDFPEDEMAELKRRGVELTGVEIVKDKKSFFWSGKYHLDMNTRDTLITDLNVLADFDPKVPACYYIRVLEIPVPRWSTYDAKSLGTEVPKGNPTSIQERAWSSAIWYTPKKG